MEEKSVYTVAEISELLSVNKETVRRWIRSDKLKGSYESKRQGVRVNKKDLEEFLLTESSPLNVKNALGVLRLCAPTLQLPTLQVRPAVVKESVNKMESELAEIKGKLISKATELDKLNMEIARLQAKKESVEREISVYSSQKKFWYIQLQSIKQLMESSDSNA